jgi:hypothetical protein
MKKNLTMDFNWELMVFFYLEKKKAIFDSASWSVQLIYG